MPGGPQFTSEKAGAALRFRLAGHWALPQTEKDENNLETCAAELLAAGKVVQGAIFDLQEVERLDTAGAWLIDRTSQDLNQSGVDTSFEKLRPEFQILLKEAHYRELKGPKPQQGSYAVNLLADIGESMVEISHDLFQNVNFLGEVMATLAGIVLSPRQFRLTSFVYHLEAIAFRSVPIIALINFLVGCIVAQQGIYQLQRFGAAVFAVDLIGILVLRELGLLLTAIMIAGRSGSAMTAELGSMKMREEIDALTVMGLRPVEVLILPRILALVVSLPLLTVVADFAGLFGGLLVTWGYGGVSPQSFLSLLREAISLHTFLIGLIKAPFMAFVIGLIASVEGLAVEGSAESLGRRVTASVVKSIFMVIVVDGLFAMFFAGIHF
jgi:phospholipid/cholesterol/gamma-HCH transport system permease protein